MGYGTTTGAGTTTTLVDTNRSESSDHWNNGTVFFLSGALAGKTAIITDWDLNTGTLTFPAQSAAPGSGADYALLDKKYRRQALVAGLNSALAELGPFLAHDDTLVTVEDQVDYTLPAGVYDVRRVQIATIATAPYDWEAPNRYWVEDAGTLRFHDGHLPNMAGMPIRIYFEDPHDRVSEDTDSVTNEVNPDLLATLAAIIAARRRAGLAGSSDPEPEKVIALIAPTYQMLRVKHPIRRMKKDSRWPGDIPSPERW